MKWLRRSVRFLLVTAGIIVLTSLGVDATQYFSGSESALGILAKRATETGCPVGMVEVESAEPFCIDAYEVSVGPECPQSQPGYDTQTAENIQAASCMPVSTEGVSPWTSVSFLQAKQLCAKAGKRLPTAEEWFTAALGTTDGACNISGSGVKSTGAAADCVSGYKVHDMVGNVWEWVDAAVVEGMYDARAVPDTGYVTAADINGVAVETAERGVPTYNNDYFWSLPSGQQVMMRGGFFGSGDDAGIYAAHADIDTNFSSQAIGFRCVL